ncbi:hypothetical protein XENTR_v10015132 [Xenopus tropicalis]|uniref:Fibrocystin n=17 Tax=Xenopus tropicalis TaxID=8364 RepID=A0A8J0QIX6_XENTR|nr:fibrocystin [Xenopus tropicalis]KAE8605431.1 hypothetical protein XENTR_v10015132 [Xenopus tropicalis]
MKAVWAPGLNTTSMGPLLPLSVCLVLPLAAACCTGYTSDPAVGSMAGGTWIMIRFNNCKENINRLGSFANGSHIDVYMTNPQLPRIICDVYPVFSAPSAINCRTRPSEHEAIYIVEVLFNGEPVSQSKENHFMFSRALTPAIHGINSSFGVPGSIIEVSGWITTEVFESYEFNEDFIDGPVIMDSKRDGWFTICSLTNDSTSIYPIRVKEGFGSLQCKILGNYIGSQNISFSIFNKGKSTVSKDAWHVSAKHELFMFQTHSEIFSVTPERGSLQGGTGITIVGNFFQYPCRVRVAGIPCKIGSVSPRIIVCTTEPEPITKKAPYPGNRGLLYELWNGTNEMNVTGNSSGYRRTWAPNATSPRGIFIQPNQPFRARLSGFFVAPETNNYTFWIQADNEAVLYLSDGEDAESKVRVASIPHGVSSWSDHWERTWDERWRQKSPKMSLTQGRKYYIELIQRGRGSKAEMSVGLQIHNTWLNPDIVNSYRREKHQIAAYSSHLPDIQMLTLSGEGWFRFCWGNATSNLLHTNSSAECIQEAIAAMFSESCETEIPAADILLHNGFEEGEDDMGTGGRTATWTEPYCGQASSFMPTCLLKWNHSNPAGYELNTYTHICFAYKGHIADELIISFSYTDTFLNTVRNKHSCHWEFNASNPERWKFGCTDLWACAKASDWLKDLHVNSSLFVSEVELQIPQNMNVTGNWFYVDEVFVAKRSTTVLKEGPQSARPGGHHLQKIAITGSYPTYNLTSVVANCGINLPLIELCDAAMEPTEDGQSFTSGNETVALTVQRLQSPSPPIGGTFAIQVSDALIPGIPVRISALHLREMLGNIKEAAAAKYLTASDFIVTKDLDTCHHVIWTLTWARMSGDLPNFIGVHAENLTGLNPTIKTRVIFDGGVFIWPILGDMLATANKLPQVTVHVNDIPAKCSGSCSFQYLQELIPVVTDIEYSSGHGCSFEVHLTGLGFTQIADEIDIEINKTNCKVTQANTTYIACCTERFLPLGENHIRLHVKPYGLAINATGNYLYLNVTPQLLWVTPTAISETGGQKVTLTGIRFDELSQVLIGSQPCHVNANGSNTIECSAPPQVGRQNEEDIAIKVGDQWFGFPKRIKYDPSLNPVMVSLSRNVSSTAGDQTLFINVSTDIVSLELEVKVQNSIAKMKSVTSEGVEVFLPAMPPGLYNVSLTVGGIIIKAEGFEPMIQYVLEVFSLEPCCGSFLGGTIITIFGRGFSTNISMINVIVGNQSCPITASSEDAIQCQTPPSSLAGSQTESIPVPVMVSILNFTTDNDSPVSNTSGLLFSYHRNFTPVVSNISWNIEGDVLLLHVAGFHLRHSVILFNNLQYECINKSNSEGFLNSSLEIPLDDLEVGRYVLKVYEKRLGYADMNSTMNMFEMFPQVQSVSPTRGSVCGGTVLTIHGSFLQPANHSVTVLISSHYTCSIESFNISTIRCIIQRKGIFHTSTTISVNVSVIIDDLPSLFQIYHMESDLTPMIKNVSSELDGAICTLYILGERLLSRLRVLVDNMLMYDVTVWNETMAQCRVNDLRPGNHSISISNVANGFMCYPQLTFYFPVFPQISTFRPINFGLNGGGLLTIEGAALQGQNATVVFVGNDRCSIKTVGYALIQCIVPPGNGSRTLTVDIDGSSYTAGDVQYLEEYTPVVYSVLQSRDVLYVGVSRISAASNVEVFVENSLCTNVSGNSLFLQCLPPQLPAGNYNIRCLDNLRGWASSNVTFVSRLEVTGVSGLGCPGRPSLDVYGSGFSPGNTSVTICGTSCEISDSLTTPTNIHCSNWHLHDSLLFLCDVSDHENCYRKQDTFIHCNVTVQSGAGIVTKPGAYVYMCSGWRNNALCLEVKAGSVHTVHLRGLFVSPKVESDKVLIYNGSCRISIATQAEMECTAPNQPITAQITAIRNNRGQNTQGQVPLYFCSLWSKNSTWPSGQPPLDGDNVTVERGLMLLLDTNTSLLNLLHIQGGKLFFIGPGPIHLRAHYILVTSGGELHVGTSREPFLGKAQISLYGSFLSPQLYPYGAKFLAVRNATLSIHGWVPRVASTHLAMEAMANDSTLIITDPVDWRIGDEAVLCGAHLGEQRHQEETFIIKNISNTLISISHPLRYSYNILEQPVEGTMVYLRPIVALLSRNIIVQGNLTTQYIDHQKECEHIEDPDASTCLYGRSERSLGTRDLGMVFIAQAFQHEPSLVLISGVQFRHIGQPFRKQPGALTIAGDICMPDSYIRGCAITRSFARGISISGTSAFTLENNVFYDIKGHGLLVGEHLEEDIEIKNNLLIRISGAHGLSSTEVLAPAAFYIRSPSNIIEGNTAYAAGYGFLYHLFPVGPSQARLQSFLENTAVSCLRFGLWLHPEYKPSGKDPAVFQGFHTWRSRGGAQITRCGNVSFIDFRIFSCEEFGISILESLGNAEVSNSFLLGRLSGKDEHCMAAGIQTPRRFQASISNTAFMNFNLPKCSPIRTCSGCFKGQGGFTIKTHQLKYLNSSTQPTFPFPHSAIIEDVDGSLTGFRKSHLLATSEILPDSCNRTSTGDVPASVCGSEVVFHRMSIGLKTAPEVPYNVGVSDRMKKMTNLNYVPDTLSNLYGWMALLVDKETYTILFNTSDGHVGLDYSVTFDNFGPGNYIMVEHKNLPSLTNISIMCGSKPGKPLQSLPSPTRNNGCDWFFNNSSESLTYLVSGEGQVGVTFQTGERLALPTPVPSAQPHSVSKWSLPKSWEGVEEGWGGFGSTIPQAGDDVIVLPNRTITVDIPLPPLGGLYVLGTLEFPSASSNVLNVTCIIIAGGEIRAGSLEQPIEPGQSLQIYVRASGKVACARLGQPRVPAGVIGVYGKLQIHSAYSSTSWTRLRADIALGNEMISLNDTVDWNPGDSIVISSSSYEAHQAELVRLRGVYGHHLRIWERLHYRHTGTVQSIDTWNITLAAEVGLLSRNVQIKTDRECSGRIMVGHFKTNTGDEYSGLLRLSNVEIANFGSSFYSAVNFLNTTLSSSVTSSSIYHSCGGAIKAVGAMNILLHANVIYSSVGNGIHIDGHNLSLTNNLLVLIKQPNNESEWVSGIKTNRAHGAFMHGNAVAGSERIGFHVKGQRCDPEEKVWARNVAHSSLHGIHYYWDDGFKHCTKIAGFLSYKNYDYGLVFHLECDVVLEDVILVDNAVGLLPVVSHTSTDSSNLSKKYILLRESAIGATSQTFDCIMDRIKPLSANLTTRERAPRSPLGGRIGIMWPQFTLQPKKWPRYPWHLLGSDGSAPGIMKLQDVAFFGFTKSCYSNDGDICIMSNPDTAGVMCPITAERTQMLHVEYGNMLHFPTALSGANCPTPGGCRGTQRVLYKDLDGSSVGLLPPVSVFPKEDSDLSHPCLSAGIYRRETQCRSNTDLQGHMCEQTDLTVVVLERIGDGRQPIAPVITFTEDFIDMFVSGNISIDQCCHSEDQSIFYSILPANKITKICFSAPTPKAMRLQLIGGQETTKLILAFFYNAPQSFLVFSNRRRIPSFLPEAELDFAEKEHGSNFFSFTESLLYVILQGEEPVEIWTNQSIYLALSVAEGTGKDIQHQLPAQVAKHLNISPSQVSILQILRGSSFTLRDLTNNQAKRNLHCPAALDGSPRVRVKRDFASNVRHPYKEARNNQETNLDVIILEIISIPDSPQFSTSHWPLSPHYQPINIADSVISALQTGEMEKMFPMDIESLMVIDPMQDLNGDSKSSVTGGDVAVYVRPHTIHIQEQPCRGYEGKPFLVQPKVTFLDAKGKRVENVGHPSNPWYLSVQLKNSAISALKGNTTVMIRNGWGNFSNLAISTFGLNWCLIFNVTSPPGVLVSALSQEFAVYPVPAADPDNIFLLVLLSSAGSAIALFLLLCCFFKRKKGAKGCQNEKSRRFSGERFNSFICIGGGRRKETE